MFKNPLSAQKDIDALVAELNHEASDAKTVATLYTKILAKGLVQGIMIGAATGTAILGTLYVYGRMTTPNEEN